MLKFILMTALAAAVSVHAAQLPNGFFEEAYIEDVPRATSLSFSPDGRLFVLQQDGQLRLIKDDALVDEAVLQVEVDATGEHGLLGLAFDPNFATNHYLYVYYTAKSPKVHSRLSRFQLNGDSAIGTETVLFELDDIGNSIFHVAGHLEFGPDGKLYFGSGDNAGVPHTDNAQLLTNFFGKMMRINSDGSIPQDNPFYQRAEGNYRAIWALGLRNPYSFAFQQGSGRLFINDIGGTLWEEINAGIAGANYGWPLIEGALTNPKFEGPIFTYAHGAVTSPTEGCGITGGTFYEGTGFPDRYRGNYFFTDYCNNWIRILDPVSGVVTDFAKRIAANPTTLKLGPDGMLYYISRWQEGVYRLGYKAQ